MTRTSVRVSVYLLLMCCVLPVMAQSAASADSVVPGMVKFAGTLNDASGKPLTGTVGVTFSLYKEQSGGAPLWMETQNVQADKAGHYSVMLGSATSHGIPAQAFSAGEARWLGVRPSDQDEQPRVVLASVPYALKALDAETLGGRPASSFLRAPAAGAKGTSPAPAPPADQANEIVCASGTACRKGSIPLFATHGGSAKVKDSIVTQEGTNVTVAGTENVTGDITSGGSVKASGSVNATIVSATDGVSTNGVVFASSIAANDPNQGDGISAVVGSVVAGGNSGVTIGVSGDSASDSGRGIMGIATGANGVGVWGEGFSTGSEEDGVVGVANGAGAGVLALNTIDGDGLFADSTFGFAGVFVGDVDVTGNLSKAGGSFKIDHPLDPANKYLYHSFVESPDMMNIYNGTVTTDAKGEAVVTLPEWFEALNRDFRYQLTCIGGFAPIYVAQKVQNNVFKIAGGRPEMEVSWQVTGVRHDAWADAHRIPLEQVKPDKERGLYLHPELFGASVEKSISAARHPEMKRIMKEVQPRRPIK
jgi:hypothetical protein